MVLARGNGSKESGDVEQIGVGANGSDQVNDEESSQHDDENSCPVLKLRGGAGPANGGKKSARLDDDARVPAAVWFLAGRMGPPPTGKQLRDRRAKEEDYVQRKQAENKAQREAKKAKKELKKAGVKIEGEGQEKGSGSGGLWKKMFGKKKKKKTEKKRGDEEIEEDYVDQDAEEKEVADED